ncbi:MAG: hypothetical protein AVDCRST_MAG90-1951, partial [uncultured Microvirga sp.]
FRPRRPGLARGQRGALLARRSRAFARRHRRGGRAPGGVGPRRPEPRAAGFRLRHRPLRGGARPKNAVRRRRGSFVRDAARVRPPLRGPRKRQLRADGRRRPGDVRRRGLRPRPRRRCLSLSGRVRRNRLGAAGGRSGPRSQARRRPPHSESLVSRGCRGGPARSRGHRRSSRTEHHPLRKPRLPALGRPNLSSGEGAL